MTRVQKLPKRLQPMLATLTDAPFDDTDWVFETKWDGFRMIANIAGGKVALYSRNGKIISDSYRDVAKALEKVKSDAVLDGELVALDAQGISHFQLLQNALRAEAPLLYCVFDVMFAAGKDLRNLPLLERKKRVRRLLPKHPLLAFSEHRPASGIAFFHEAQERGLEGIMAKRASSPYLSGARTADWLKIKTARRQEVVIAGFTAPRRSRPAFWGACSRSPGGQGLALYRPCRHRLFARHPGATPRQALETPNTIVTVCRACKGRSGHDLGETETGRRGQIHRMDVGRRDAASGVPGAAGGQAGRGRRARKREVPREEAVMSAGRLLIILGIVLVVLGMLWPLIARLGLGRLPGDIVIERENFRLYIPIVTSLIISIVLSVILWLVNR